MKVIFLDIDGVLNCGECFKRHHDEWEAAGRPKVYKIWSMLEASHIEQLNRILKETGAKICISSAWRGDPKTPSELYKAGLLPEAEIVGTTPHLRTPVGMSGWDWKERGKEIQWWLDRHPEVEKYCIIDDDSDMLPHQKLFKTKFTPAGDGVPVGLTPEIADDVIEYLGLVNS